MDCAKRSSQLPDVPTIAEAGLPGYESITWFGLLAPAKTPGRIVARLNDAMASVVHGPDIRSQLESQGYDVGGSSPGEFATFIRMELEKYATVVKASGARVH